MEDKFILLKYHFTVKTQSVGVEFYFKGLIC